jgi:hypothetical protein
MTTYHDLVMQCPACIAERGYDPKPPRQWYHASCGGTILIGENAYCRCVGCGHSSHVKHWRYACHINLMDDRPTIAPHFASSGHLAHVVSICGGLANRGGTQWLLTFLENLGDW